MEIQSTNIPRMDITSMIGPGIHLPCINEMAAVVIGCVLTSPKTSQEDKESTRELISSLETVDVVYQQNTADELNIVVPDFPEFMEKLRPLTQEQLAHISGGFEIIVALFFTFADTAIGCALGSIGVALGVGAGITLSGTTLYLGSSVLTGMAVVGGITALAVTSAVGVGISLGVATRSAREGPVGPVSVAVVG